METPHVCYLCSGQANLVLRDWCKVCVNCMVVLDIDIDVATTKGITPSGELVPIVEFGKAPAGDTTYLRVRPDTGDEGYDSLEERRQNLDVDV